VSSRGFLIVKSRKVERSHIAKVKDPGAIVKKKGGQVTAGGTEATPSGRFNTMKKRGQEER